MGARGIGTKDWYINKFGEVIGIKKYNIRVDNNSKCKTLEGYIEKYGKDKGFVKYKEKNSNLSIGVESLKRRGYNDKTIKQIRAVHKEKSLNSLSNFIKRYGKKEGQIRHKSYRLHQDSNYFPNGKIYWKKRGINNDKEINEKIYKFQSKNLKKFINLYGVEGYEKYEKYNKSKGITKEQFIKKHGIERAKIVSEKRGWRKGRLPSYVTKSKTELEILNWFKLKLDNNWKIFGGDNEYCFYLKKQEQKVLGGQGMFPDIVLFGYNLKIIIEYYGDYWHGHINLFKDKDFIHPIIKKPIKDIRKRDKYKQKIMKERNFIVYIINEFDFKKGKNTILNNILNEINKKRKI